MGDPRKQRKKFSTPSHPWQKERIDEEKDLSKEYGLRTKQEIWKMNSILRRILSQAKRLATIKTKQDEIEKEQILNKLVSLNLISESAQLEDVLELTLKDILERRLQSVVFRKGFARSMKQARQFITHEHVTIDGKKITSPSFLVLKEKENFINFAPNSELADEMHPERAKKEEVPKKPTKEEKESSEEKKEEVKEDKKEAKEKKKPTKKVSEKKPKAKEEKPKKAE